MICVLCLNNGDQTIDIFSEEGLTLNACDVISKHFWVQPKKDDKTARYICGSCWNALYSFHQFFKQVEVAHSSVLPAVKLEFKEDTEACPLSSENGESIEQIIASLDATSQEPQLSIIKTTDDLEIKLAKTSIAKPSDTLENEDVESSPEEEWADHHSDEDDDDDDDDEDDDEDEDQREDKQKVKKGKAVPRPPDTKTGKKRGRPLKGTPKKTPPKEISEELVKKQKISLEFDTIIQNHMELTCNNCILTLPNFRALRKHYRSHHRQRGYASCCSKKFYSKSILVDHIHTHLNPEYFKCDKCSKVLADRRCLEVHMDMHIEANQRVFQCDQCNKSFSKEVLLSRHMHIHIPEEERKFPCEECNKLFSSSFTLKAHMNNVHQHTYGKICEQCGKSIRGREAFERHLLEHAGVPIPGEQCDKCGAKLKNKYCLKRHIRAKHADMNVPHVCIVCGKVAPNEPALQRHYYFVHKCERNHKCPMCEKAFKKASGLKEHMTTHTGEILYTCPYCPKTFNSNANMHSHRKKMHRKEWEENREAAAQAK